MSYITMAMASIFRSGTSNVVFCALFCLIFSAEPAARAGTLQDLVTSNQFNVATPLAQARYDSLRQTDGPATATTLNAAHLLLQCQIALGQTGAQTTLDLARQTLQRREKLLGADHADVGFSQSALAVILDWNQEYRQARILHDQAISTLRTTLPTNDRRLGLALLKAGGTYREMRHYEPATALMDEGYAVLLSASGPRSLDVAEALNVQSNLYRNLGQPEIALATVREALDIQLEQLPPDHLTLGHTYASLGYIYNGLQQYDKGFEALDRSIAIFSTQLSPDHPNVAFALTTTAGYLMQRGDLAAAEQRLQKALHIRGRVYGTDSVPYSVILVRLGRFYSRIGEYEKARDCQQQVVAIRRQWHPPGDNTVASALWSLAETRRNLGDLVGTRRDLREALIVQAAEDHPNPVWRARIHKELGRVEMKLNNHRGARRHLNEAWVIVAKLDETNTEQDDLLLVDGDLMLAAGQLANARTAYTKAASIALPRGAAGQNALAAALGRRAELEILCGNSVGAETHLRRAMEILTTRLGNDHPALVESSLDLAIVMADKGKNDVALNLALAAEQNSRAHFRRIARTMSEASALRYAQIRPAGIAQALALIERVPSGDNIGRLWAEVAASRALVLDEITGRYQHRDRNSAQAVALQRALQTYANLLVRGPAKYQPQLYPEQLATARTAVERQEKVLATEAGSKQVPAAQESFDWQQLKQNLPTDTSLLAFVKSPVGPPKSTTNEYFAFLSPAATDIPQFWRIGSAAVVDNLVAEMKHSLSFSPAERERKYRTAAEQLRRLIWDPLATHCPPDRDIFVVPDGTLNLISLGALPTHDGHYLLESRQFHYLTAERDILQNSRQQPRQQGILAMGGVDFEAKVFGTGNITVPAPIALASAYRSPLTLCPKLQDLVFAPLPGSADEVANIIEAWTQKRVGSPALILTGAAASELTFKNIADQYNVIHLATHGFIVGPGCSDLGNGFRGVGGFVPESADPPLALSGLALAGANQRFDAPVHEQDGILTSLEIATLDLRETSLVVLSGCDTGGGTVQDGEGVFGLRRSVHIAGAQTLVMSLWPAEDQITRDWMNTMYKNYLFSEHSISKSVRLASLDALYKRRAEHLDTHPAFWGCFIASGGKGR